MAVLPASGNLSIKDAAGLNRSIQYEVTGSLSGTKSLAELGALAGFSAPYSMRDFLGYDHGTTAVTGCGRSATSALDSCTDAGISIRTYYVRTDVGWDAGSIVYTDAARTTPLTGFTYVTNGLTLRNWTINSSTGALTGDDSQCIPI